jgi:hypothetical protein
MHTPYTPSFDEELDLGRRFDDAPEQPAQMRRYIEQHHPHLLKVYDPECLAQAIAAARGGRAQLTGT